MLTVTQLITMEKTAVDDGPPPTFDDYDELEGKDAGHKEFNKKAGLQSVDRSGYTDKCL